MVRPKPAVASSSQSVKPRTTYHYFYKEPPICGSFCGLIDEAERRDLQIHLLVTLSYAMVLPLMLS